MKSNLAAAVVALVLLTPACGGEEPRASRDASSTRPGSRPSPSSPSSPSPSDGEVWLEVWFNEGERLAADYTVVPTTPAVGRAAIEALLAGPRGGLGTQVPEGTRLLGLTVSGGIATVDLSGEFASGGGSLSMSMRLAQVVYTLTQFPTVDSVRLHLDGEPVHAFSGEGLDTSEPLRRSDFVDLAPPIVVTSPPPGARVSRGARLEGDADVFEATVSFRILDADREVVGEGFTTATCGTGCRGTFGTRLKFDVSEEQDGTIEVFSASAEDGSDQHVVAVPVRLAP